MNCREARRLLDQGLTPGSSSPDRAELGFPTFTPYAGPLCGPTRRLLVLRPHPPEPAPPPPQPTLTPRPSQQPPPPTLPRPSAPPRPTAPPATATPAAPIAGAPVTVL